MHSLELIDYIVIVAILLSLIGVGLYFTKKGGEDMDSFFVSGRSLPWYIGGTSMIATSFAADTPLWVSALVRSHGVHYIWQFWAPLIGSALAVVYFGRKWRRMAFVTDIEFMEARYDGTPAKTLRGWTGAWGALVICPLISAWVIKAMETIGREAVGLPPESQVAVTIAVVTVALLMCGLSGLFGVVYTDFIQFLLATFGTVLLAVLSVKAVGGLDAMVEQLKAMGEWGGKELSIAPRIGDAEGQMSMWNAVGYFGFLWIGVGLCGGYQAQRLLASKDSKHASYAQLLHTIVYYSLMAWPWVLVALCSLILIPELDVADQSAAYPRMIVMILPIGLRGLLVAALLAAFISTISTLFNWGSSYLVNDIYRRFLNPHATEKNYVLIARGATVFMAIVGAYISLQAENIQQLLTLAYVLGSAGVVPGVLRWLWWRTTGKGELAALIVGWIMTILLIFMNTFDGPAQKIMNIRAASECEIVSVVDTNTTVDPAAEADVNVTSTIDLIFPADHVAEIPASFTLTYAVDGKDEQVALTVQENLGNGSLRAVADSKPAGLVAGITAVEEGILFSSDPNLVGARMLLMVVSVGLACIIGSLLTKPEDMDQLKRFAMRARPFAFGWRPVISQMQVVYVEQEPIGRTLVSWAIAMVAIISLLVGVGKLLLGSPLYGLGLLVVGVVTLVMTIRRIAVDCAGDEDEGDFLEELETKDSK